MTRKPGVLNVDAENKELQTSLDLANPPTQSEVVREARERPEGPFQLYYWRFPAKKEPAILRNRAAAEKPPQQRTLEDYIYFPTVALRCKAYIGDSFQFNQVPSDELEKAISKPYANSTADADAGKASGRGFIQTGGLLLPKVGTSYGIVFKGQVSQGTVDGATGNTPIRGNVVRVRVPNIVRAYHMIAALRNAANFNSAAARAAVVGIVLPGGRRLLWGDLDRTEGDG